MTEQAGVIAFRGAGRGVEVCLIRRKGSRRKWGIPKGFIDPGETPQDAALKEALEEAGLTGRLVGDPIGSYEYQKWGGRLAVTVYLMEVTAERDDWAEADFRERHWKTFDDAAELLVRHPVLTLIETAKARLP